MRGKGYPVRLVEDVSEEVGGRCRSDLRKKGGSKFTS